MPPITKHFFIPVHTSFCNLFSCTGAGDTFNATVIYCLHKGLDVRKSVELGCKIASEKLKIRGFKGIRDAAQKCFQDIQ